MRASCSDEPHRRGGRPRLDPALEFKGLLSWLVGGREFADEQDSVAGEGGP